MCEKKRRHMQENTKPVQLGFRAYQLFYEIGARSQKTKTYKEFVDSNYYNGFVKFGHYAIDLGIDDIPSYVKYLIIQQVPLDKWCSDRHFTTWRKERTQHENVERALERTIKFLEEWSQETGHDFNDYWTKVNHNLAAFHISTGRISPWVVYASAKAQDMINNFNEDQINMVSEMLDVDKWQWILANKSADYSWICDIVRQARL